MNPAPQTHQGLGPCRSTRRIGNHLIFIDNNYAVLFGDIAQFHRSGGVRAEGKFSSFLPRKEIYEQTFGGQRYVDFGGQQSEWTQI